MEERDRKTELLVGLFLFIGLLLLSLLILQFSSVRELFKDSYDISVEFPDGTGIKEGTPVMLGGSRIGKVTAKPSLNATYNGVIIPMEIYETVQVPSDSKIGIGTSGLLGDAYIEIKTTGQPAATYIQPGDHLKGQTSAGLASLQNNAEAIAKKLEVALEEVSKAVVDLRISLKRVNEGALSEDAMKDLKESFAHVNSVVTRLDEKTLNEETSTDVKEAVASFRAAAKSLEESVKKLEPAFARIDGVVKKADGVMATADEAMKSIDASADAIGKVATDLTKGEGLLGALIHDASLRADFKALIANLRERGVLFYKDKSGESSSSRPTPPPLPGHGFGKR